MHAPQLEEQLAGLEREYDGRFTLAVERLDQPGRFLRDAERILQTASACKLFILCELFRQARAGILSLDQLHTPGPECRRGGDGVLRAMTTFPALSLHQLAVLMVIVSDNVATRALTDVVGPRNVQKSMDTWGLSRSQFHEGLYPASVSGVTAPSPVSSAADLCSLMVRLYRHEVLTPEDCEEIIRILRAQRCNDMLPRYIPVAEDWGAAKTWIANKTGFGACRVEAGIVHTDSVTYAMAMFFEPRKSPPALFKCLADYPPVLAMAKACKAVHESFSSAEKP